MPVFDQFITDNFAWYHADACEAFKEVPDASVGLHIHSPPFSNLYIYSDSIRDMGNATDDEEFFKHYEFLIPELLRTTMPRRLCAVHCKDLPLYRGRDGAAGLKDFPGRIIAAFERCGWVYHSRVTIWKDPVIEMQRTKNHGLLYKELCKDSSCSRQGMADFVLTFRKWGTGAFPYPITAGPERFEAYSGLQPPDPWPIADKYDVRRPPLDGEGRFPRANPFPFGSEAHREWSIAVWQRYASPVWFDIDQTDVLNYKLGRDAKDEKHICPLQLGVVERLVHLWSNPGDVVCSCFGGIASEGYKAVRMGRKFLGTELKESYWRLGGRNLERAVRERDEEAVNLFSGHFAKGAGAGLPRRERRKRKPKAAAAAEVTA